MNKLTARQKEILTRVIESHITTSLPVGSRALAGRYDLSLSPASLRHEMGILEELGYLTHPHTSAGRLPTDRGYRFYVRDVVKEEPIPEAVLDFIAAEMKGKIENLEGLMERASRVLSAMAQEAVLLMSPQLRRLYLKELNLVPLDPTRVLAVWCTTSGVVQNCLVEMGTPISADEAVRIRNFIKEEFAGEAVDSLEEALLVKMKSCRDSLRWVYERTLEIIRRSLPYWEVSRLFVEGSRYILSQPEFQDLRKLERLMTALEEKSGLFNLLKHQPLEAGVHVAIGEEELSKDIWDCALVSAPYLWHGRWVGTLGILGPRRMPYGRMMGLAHQMSEEISQALDQWSA